MSNLRERVTKMEIHETKVELANELKANDIKLDPEFKLPAVINNEDAKKVILPREMNKLQAASNLIQQFQEEETFRNYNRSYANFFLNDFIVTVGKLIPEWFGMLHVSPVNTEGYPAQQDYIQIPTGFDAKGKLITEKAYVGSIKAPVWENCVIDITPNNIIVRAKMKFEAKINQFLAEVEDSVRKNSVVRGKAVTVSAHPSGILIATPINPKENKLIVLSNDTERIINNLIIPGLKQKRKSSLLFTGDFGTGKTESAIRVGMAAVEKFDRTFFYLHNSDMFVNLIPYIKNYQAALTFVEDVDQISAGDRDSGMNDLLNQLDGNELKGVNCTFIFTTNNHDKIHPAMRRPGRIDQMVHFDFCDVEQIAKIFMLYAENMKGANAVDYKKAAEDCPELIQGAVVAEIARRAIQYANEFHNSEISTDRFLDAIASMRHQIEFMRKDQKKDHTVENLLAHVVYKSISKAFPKLEEAKIANQPVGFQDSPYKGFHS